MVTDVGNILTAAQNAQLLALKKSATQVDEGTLRLSTGLFVNSAIDNPTNYFIARALRNKADDLARLLDGIDQNLNVIKEANIGIDAELKILDQAESYLQDIQKKHLAGEIEFTGPPANETAVTFTLANIIPYDAAQDFPASGTVTVSGGGTQLTLSGNFWKRMTLNYNITANTVLEFDYTSTVTVDISSIGFDSDTNYGNDNRRFYLSGTQTSGLTYAAPLATYTYTGGTEHYTIPIGTYFTGNFGFINFINDDDALPYGNATYANVILREGPKQAPTASLKYEQEYAAILEQMDLITIDANYRGVNLLAGDDMTTFFNPDRTSKLVTEGIDATSAGLGLQVEDFNSAASVEAKLEQVRVAREKLRSYASTLSTDFNVIKIRQEFTAAQINTSKEGADLLTLADPNEEGAKLLALQTRQQIGISILSLRPANILSVFS